MATYHYKTRAGTFFIKQAPLGWTAWLMDECFEGPYETAQGLCEDVAYGHTAWPSCGDPAELDISDNLSDWEETKTT